MQHDGLTERLCLRTLAKARGADTPRFPRPGAPSIVHLGLGAFARAHLGTYADDLLRRGWPAGVHGVSLHNAGTERRLTPQDGLYTAVVREPGRLPSLRVVGALTAVSTGPEAALRAIAAPTTRLVTLTVTEKGYESSASSSPSGAAGVIAQALAERRRTAAPPLVLASLDNVSGNGSVLSQADADQASYLDSGLAGWIEEEVRFASSVVDRIVPAMTGAELDDINRRLGLVDLAAVTTESHRSWVITREPGLPPLDDVGVELVTDIAPYERRKLWLLNGPHSALAYCGLLGGHTTIAAAVSDPEIFRLVQALVDETLQVAQLPADADGLGFSKQALQRFANPALGHTCAQVGADGSRKLPQRLLPVVAARRYRRLTTTKHASVVAIWLAAVAGVPIQDKALPQVDDPDAAALRAAFVTAGTGSLVAAALKSKVGDGFAGEVQAALDRLIRCGRSTLNGNACTR